jgi:hypothetical protein
MRQNTPAAILTYAGWLISAIGITEQLSTGARHASWYMGECQRRFDDIHDVYLIAESFMGEVRLREFVAVQGPAEANEQARLFNVTKTMTLLGSACSLMRVGFLVFNRVYSKV